jgi:hypothetical protein
MNAAIHIPTVSSSAMLVELTLSAWSGRKLDKKASDEVVRDNNAHTGVARVNKDLLGNCAELKDIHKFDANLRNQHYRYTLPWSDGNPARLLATKYYQQYTADITGMLLQRDALIDALTDAYDWEVVQARVKLGDMFNANDYPSVDSIRRRFAHTLSFMPVPDTGHWVVDLGNETATALRAQCEHEITTRVGKAMQDVWERLHTALTHMTERLDYSDTKKIFRDSLVSNVEEVLEVMALCNLTGDAAMEQARVALSTALRGVTPEGLREDAALRRETKRAVDAVIATLPSLW